MVVHFTAPVRSSRAATYGLLDRPTATKTWPSATNADEVISAPSLSTCVDHTFWPVSALTAKTQPVVDAMNMHPSAMTGVPVKSPSPPAWRADMENALCSVGACNGPIVCSAGCDRVLDRS